MSAVSGKLIIGHDDHIWAPVIVLWLNRSGKKPVDV